MFSGFATPNKNFTLHVNRAIWYNDVDRKHSFNFRFVRARVHLAIMSKAVREGKFDQIPDLQVGYSHGCLDRQISERDGTKEDDRFASREKFLEDWQNTDEDIYVFTRGEIDRFKKAAQELAAALPVDTGIAQATAATFAQEEEEEILPEQELEVQQALGEDMSGVESDAMETEMSGMEGNAVVEHDFEMLDRGDLDVGGPAYNEAMAGQGEMTEQERMEWHREWMRESLVTIVKHCQELLSREPRDVELLNRYYDQIMATEDQQLVDEMRSLMSSR